jgi:hypothetical protein
MVVPSIAGHSIKRSGGSVIHALSAVPYLSVTAEMDGRLVKPISAGGEIMWQLTQT